MSKSCFACFHHVGSTPICGQVWLTWLVWSRAAWAIAMLWHRRRADWISLTVSFHCNAISIYSSLNSSFTIGLPYLMIFAYWSIQILIVDILLKASMSCHRSSRRTNTWSSRATATARSGPSKPTSGDCPTWTPHPRPLLPGIPRTWALKWWRKLKLKWWTVDISPVLVKQLFVYDLLFDVFDIFCIFCKGILTYWNSQASYPFEVGCLVSIWNHLWRCGFLHQNYWLVASNSLPQEEPEVVGEPEDLHTGGNGSPSRGDVWELHQFHVLLSCWEGAIVFFPFVPAPFFQDERVGL